MTGTMATITDEKALVRELVWYDAQDADDKPVQYRSTDQENYELALEEIGSSEFASVWAFIILARGNVVGALEMAERIGDDLPKRLLRHAKDLASQEPWASLSSRPSYPSPDAGPNSQ